MYPPWFSLFLFFCFVPSSSLLNIFSSYSLFGWFIQQVQTLPFHLSRFTLLKLCCHFLYAVIMLTCFLNRLGLLCLYMASPLPAEPITVWTGLLKWITGRETVLQTWALGILHFYNTLKITEAFVSLPNHAWWWKCAERWWLYLSPIRNDGMRIKRTGLTDSERVMGARGRVRLMERLVDHKNAGEAVEMACKLKMPFWLLNQYILSLNICCIVKALWLEMWEGTGLKERAGKDILSALLYTLRRNLIKSSYSYDISLFPPSNQNTSVPMLILPFNLSKKYTAGKKNVFILSIFSGLTCMIKWRQLYAHHMSHFSEIYSQMLAAVKLKLFV